MKLIVEFELGEAWEAYHADDDQRLKALLRDNLEEVHATIVKDLNLPIVSCWLPIPEDIDEKYDHYLDACRKNCMIEYYDGSRRRFNENYLKKRAVAYRKE